MENHLSNRVPSSKLKKYFGNTTQFLTLLEGEQETWMSDLNPTYIQKM